MHVARRNNSGRVIGAVHKRQALESFMQQRKVRRQEAQIEQEVTQTVRSLNQKFETFFAKHQAKARA